MRFMMIVKGNADSEAGVLPSEETLATMNKYNEELVRSGVLLDAAGLQPTKAGWKVKFSGAKRSIVDGPFAEAKECIAGYWVIQTKTREEALEWSKRVPFQDGEIEIRQLFDMDDFPQSAATDEAREIEKRAARK
jgi:hypothetical protein